MPHMAPLLDVSLHLIPPLHLRPAVFALEHGAEVCLLVLGEIRGICEALAAFWTYVWFLARMYRRMGFEFRGCGEALVTMRAQVRFFACVCSLVFDERVASFHLYAAELALEGLVPGMYLNVAFQFWPSAKAAPNYIFGRAVAQGLWYGRICTK